MFIALGLIVWFIISIFVIYGQIKLDLYLNPWLNDGAIVWNWYNYIPSWHGATLLFITNSYWWLLHVFAFFLITICSLLFWLKND
jgi:hypothetical protein